MDHAPLKSPSVKSNDLVDRGSGSKWSTTSLVPSGPVCWCVSSCMPSADVMAYCLPSELYAVGRRDGVLLAVSLQIRAAGELEPIVIVVGPLADCHIDERLVLLQLDLRNVESQIEEAVAVACTELRSGLLPHDLLSLCRPCCCNKSKQDDNDCFIHLMFTIYLFRFLYLFTMCPKRLWSHWKGM